MTDVLTAPAPNGAVPVTIRSSSSAWTITILGEPVGDYLAITPAFMPPLLSTPPGPHRIWSGLWMIYHRPTGNRLLPYGLCLKHARQAADELDACGVDWDRPRDVLVSDPAVAEAIHPYWDGDAPTCTSMCRPRR